MELVTFVTTLAVLLVFGFNAESFIGTDVLGLGSSTFIDRVAKAFCGSVMAYSLAHAAERFRDSDTQAIGSGNNHNNTPTLETFIPSNGTCPWNFDADSFEPVLSGDAVNDLWYMPMQPSPLFVNPSEGNSEPLCSSSGRDPKSSTFFGLGDLFAIAFIISLPFKLVRWIYSKIRSPGKTHNNIATQTINVDSPHSQGSETDRLAQILTLLTTLQASLDNRSSTGDWNTRTLPILEDIGRSLSINNTTQRRLQDVLESLLEKQTTTPTNDRSIEEIVERAVQERISHLHNAPEDLERRIQRLEEQGRHHEPDSEAINSLYETQRNQLQDLAANVEQHKKDSETNINSVREAQTRQLQILQASVEQHKKSSDNDMQRLSNDIKTHIYVTKSSLSVLNKELNKSIGSVDDVKNEMNEFGEKIKKLEATTSDRTAKSNPVLQKMERTTQEVQKLAQSASENAAKNAKSISNLTLKISNIEKEHKTVSNVSNSLVNLQKQFQELQTRIERAQQNLSSMEQIPNQLQQLRNGFDALQRDKHVPGLSDAMDALDTKFKNHNIQLSAELESMRSDINSLKKNPSASDATKRIEDLEDQIRKGETEQRKSQDEYRKVLKNLRNDINKVQHATVGIDERVENTIKQRMENVILPEWNNKLETNLTKLNIPEVSKRVSNLEKQVSEEIIQDMLRRNLNSWTNSFKSDIRTPIMERVSKIEQQLEELEEMHTGLKEEVRNDSAELEPRLHSCIQDLKKLKESKDEIQVLSQSTQAIINQLKADLRAKVASLESNNSQLVTLLQSRLRDVEKIFREIQSRLDFFNAQIDAGPKIGDQQNLMKKVAELENYCMSLSESIMKISDSVDYLTNLNNLSSHDAAQASVQGVPNLTKTPSTMKVADTGFRRQPGSRSTTTPEKMLIDEHSPNVVQGKGSSTDGVQKSQKGTDSTSRDTYTDKSVDPSTHGAKIALAPPDMNLDAKSPVQNPGRDQTAKLDSSVELGPSPRTKKSMETEAEQIPESAESQHNERADNFHPRQQAGSEVTPPPSSQREVGSPRSLSPTKISHLIATPKSRKKYAQAFRMQQDIQTSAVRMSFGRIAEPAELKLAQSRPAQLRPARSQAPPLSTGDDDIADIEMDEDLKLQKTREDSPISDIFPGLEPYRRPSQAAEEETDSGALHQEKSTASLTGEKKTESDKLIIGKQRNPSRVATRTITQFRDSGENDKPQLTAWQRGLSFSGRPLTLPPISWNTGIEGVGGSGSIPKGQEGNSSRVDNRSTVLPGISSILPSGWVPKSTGKAPSNEEKGEIIMTSSDENRTSTAIQKPPSTDPVSSRSGIRRKDYGKQNDPASGGFEVIRPPAPRSQQEEEDRKVRHDAVAQAFSSIKGTSMSQSRWAVAEEAESPTPVPATTTNTSASSMKETGTNQKTPQTKGQGSSQSQGLSLSQSRWATVEEPEATTPANEAEDSPARSEDARNQGEVAESVETDDDAMEIWEERQASPPGNQSDSMEYDCEDDPFAHISQEVIFEDEIRD